MVDWKKTILDPQITTVQVFAGDVLNSVVNYHNNIDLAAGDPLGIARISTETIFANNKFKLAGTGGGNAVKFSVPSYAEEKTVSFPASLGTTEEALFASAVQTVSGKQMSGATNTFVNIPNSALDQITDKAKLHSQIAYKDVSDWLTNAMVATHTSTKISITNKSQLNSSILYSDVSNNLGDNYLQFGDIGIPSNPSAGNARVFYNQATSHMCALKPSGTVTDLEEALAVINAGFVPLTRGGTAQLTGNGTQKEFTIEHNLGAVPDMVTVEPASADARGDYFVTKDLTNLTITYPVAPPAGAVGNVKLEWGVNTAAHATSSFAGGGIKSFTATAGQTVFNIPHSLGVIPQTYYAIPQQTLGSTDHYITADNTNIIVTYNSAPGAGAINFVWGCGFVTEAWEGQQQGTMPAGGTISKTGNGSTTTFTIAHGLATTPQSFYVLPTSVDARGSYNLSVDTTNITIQYPEPPPSGSAGNLTYVWGATFIGAFAETAFTPGTTDTFTNKTIGDWLDFTNIPAPADPPTEMGRLYLKTIDANNNALCVKLQIAGTVQEVQIAP